MKPRYKGTCAICGKELERGVRRKVSMRKEVKVQRYAHGHIRNMSEFPTYYNATVCEECADAIMRHIESGRMG